MHDPQDPNYPDSLTIFESSLNDALESATNPPDDEEEAEEE